MRGLETKTSACGLAQVVERGASVLQRILNNHNQTMKLNYPIIKKLMLAMTVCAACIALESKAAISVGPGGSVTMTFNALPMLSDGWSTLGVSGDSAGVATPDEWDMAVQTNA